jgi:hypothetical protein
MREKTGRMSLFSSFRMEVFVAVLLKLIRPVFSRIFPSFRRPAPVFVCYTASCAVVVGEERERKSASQRSEGAALTAG